MLNQELLKEYYEIRFITGPPFESLTFAERVQIAGSFGFKQFEIRKEIDDLTSEIKRHSPTKTNDRLIFPDFSELKKQWRAEHARRENAVIALNEAAAETADALRELGVAFKSAGFALTDTELAATNDMVDDISTAVGRSRSYVIQTILKTIQPNNPTINATQLSKAMMKQRKPNRRISLGILTWPPFWPLLLFLILLITLAIKYFQ